MDVVICVIGIKNLRFLWSLPLYCTVTDKIILAQIPSVESSQSIGQPSVFAKPDHEKLVALHFLQLLFSYEVGTGEDKPVYA